MIRLKTERYAVGEAEFDGIEVTVGIFYEPGEDAAALASTAKRFAHDVLWKHHGNHAKVADDVETAVNALYPGRPFYAETWELGMGVQVYQPYGMPRDGTVPPEHGPWGPPHFGRLPEHES